MEMPRQQYSRELKIATMRELDAGKSLAHVAREYQLSPRRLDKSGLGLLRKMSISDLL
jgi:hypothetical protein